MEKKLSSYRESQKKQFGELCTKAVNLIADHTGKRRGEVDEEWKKAIGKESSSSNMINKYKSGKSIPRDPSHINWLIEHGVIEGHLGMDWVNKLYGLLNYRNDDLINVLSDKTGIYISLDTTPKSLLLPPSSYTHFVERSVLYEIMKFLSSPATVIIIKSIGGNGKTCLAFEIATRCTSTKPEYADLPIFNSIVWISGKENISDAKIKVFDTIAQNLGFADILKDPFEEKIKKITEILRTQKILLIIDNFETIEDPSELSEWLLKIPSPSKCIVTTRVIYENFVNASINGNCKIKRITGMSQEEARILIQNKAIELELHIDKISVFDKLIEKVEGNPKAIELALGIMKQKKQTLNESIDELLSIGENFMKDLFDLSWGLLNNEERKLLQILTLFPYGIDKFTLGKISSVQNVNLKNGLNKLIDLSLLNNIHKTTEIYYFLHSLVKEFASQKFEDNPEKHDIRHGWMEAYLEMTEKVAHCHGEANTEDLKILDKDGFKEGLEYIVSWAMDNKKYDFVIQATDNVKYYFYIRGFWASKLNILRAEAAKKTSNIQAEFDAYIYHLNILCKQENVKEISKYLPIIKDLKDLHENELTQESLIDFDHDLAIYHYMQNEYAEAIKLWGENMKKATNQRQINTNKRWLGNALFKNGDLQLAKEYLIKFADEVLTNEYNHNSLSAYLIMCKMQLQEKSNDALDSILLGLEKSKDSQDHFYIAEYEFLLAKYYIEKNNVDLAKKSFFKAYDAFKANGCISRVNTVESLMKKYNLL